MKHYVLGFVFNKAKDQVLLIEKKRPEWQAGHWNGIGGKKDDTDNNPLTAMYRECHEEIGTHYKWQHCVTFVCPGGTVFVYKAICRGEEIAFNQKEDERLMTWEVSSLPTKVMANLKWLIPVCLSNIQFPLMIQQNTLGVE